MRKTALLGVVVTVALLASCTSVSFEGLQMQKDIPSYTVIKEFEKAIADPHILGMGTSFGLIPLGQPDKEIFDTIRGEIDKVSGDAAIDVTISYGMSAVDMVLNSFTGGIYSPRRITIKGTIVKFN